MNKDDAKRIERELAEEGIKVKVTLTGTRPKRLVKYMTQPARIIAGIPIALFLDWLNSSGHHMTQSQFWFAYVCWFPAIFIVFWLYELHHWAGGKRLD